MFFEQNSLKNLNENDHFVQTQIWGNSVSETNSFSVFFWKKLNKSF